MNIERETKFGFFFYAGFPNQLKSNKLLYIYKQETKLSRPLIINMTDVQYFMDIIGLSLYGTDLQIQKGKATIQIFLHNTKAH